MTNITLQSNRIPIELQFIIEIHAYNKNMKHNFYLRKNYGKQQHLAHKKKKETLSSANLLVLLLIFHINHVYAVK